MNQPIPPAMSGGPGQYDFILNGNQKPKKSLLPSGNSKKQRIMLVVGGGLALLLVFAVIMMLIFSSGGEDRKSLVKLVQTQTEIARLSNEASGKSRDPVTLNFTQTTALVLTTSKNQTTEYLAKQRIKIGEKELALGRDAKDDQALVSAEKAGRYDDEAIKIIEQSLADYKTQIQQDFKAATGKNHKQLLQDLYKQAETLTKNQPTSS